MSAGGQTTRSRDIPAVRRVAVHDSAHMPQDYSTTPGGTVFSTTPGGTRIIYDRKFLLQCRSSPLTRTPPNMPDIPGVTRPLKPDSSTSRNQPEQTPSNNTDHNLQTEENAVTQPSQASILLALRGIPLLSGTPEELCGLENVTRASIVIVKMPNLKWTSNETQLRELK